jgi:hypothetical protein
MWESLIKNLSKYVVLTDEETAIIRSVLISKNSGNTSIFSRQVRSPVMKRLSAKE